MQKKENIFIFSLAIILVIIVVIIVWLTFNPEKTPKQSPSLPNPTTSVVNPSSIPTQNHEDIVQFDANAEKVLLDKLINREPLSDADIAARTKILNLLPDTSGIAYSSATISVEYVEPMDEFQVKILTTAIDQAKGEAVTWFRDQGMSQQGICDLPVNFIVSPEVSNYLHTNKIVFNVLPKECINK